MQGATRRAEAAVDVRAACKVTAKLRDASSAELKAVGVGASAERVGHGHTPGQAWADGQGGQWLRLPDAGRGPLPVDWGLSNKHSTVLRLPWLSRVHGLAGRDERCGELRRPGWISSPQGNRVGRGGTAKGCYPGRKLWLAANTRHAQATCVRGAWRAGHGCRARGLCQHRSWSAAGWHGGQCSPAPGVMPGQSVVELKLNTGI